jgi:Domain of unknown function (DUF4926)
MPRTQSNRDRIAYLRQLAVDSLKSYHGGFAELERVDQDLDSIIASLEDVADPSWSSFLRGQWGYLEVTYASALAHDRYHLTQDEEVDVQAVVDDLHAEFRGYEVPLTPEDKPEEGDVVRLLRTLPRHDLAAGSTGTVVVDYAKYSGGDAPLEYEVEFSEPDATTKTLVTLTVDDVEVLSRPRYGNPAR